MLVGRDALDDFDDLDDLGLDGPPSPTSLPAKGRVESSSSSGSGAILGRR